MRAQIWKTEEMAVRMRLCSCENGQRRVKKDVMSYATKQVATKRLKMQSKEVYVRDCETSTENPVKSSNAVPPTT